MSEPSPQPEPKYGDDQFNVPEKACTQFSHAGGVVSVGGGFVFDVKAPRAFSEICCLFNIALSPVKQETSQ
jgi:hypothetical protein